MEADLLILLSDVAGLYDKNPKNNKNANLIQLIKKIDSNIYKSASTETNIYGSGGMFTKIQAAEIASSFGCNTLIFQGNIQKPILNLKRKTLGHYLFLIIRKKGFKKLVSWIN